MAATRLGTWLPRTPILTGTGVGSSLSSSIGKVFGGERRAPFPDQLGSHWEPSSFNINNEKHNRSVFGLPGSGF